MELFKNKLNILVIGSDGMLGHDVYEYYKELSMHKGTDIGKVFGVDRAKGQPIINYSQIYDLFKSSVHFDVCINCVAYTDTKGAEEPYADNFLCSKKKLSYNLNAELPYYIANICKEYKTKLIHISTDYVFSEDNVIKDIIELPTPKNVYGEHKYIGELHIKNAFGKKSKDYAILRTSWLYGMTNSKSFVHKFLLNTFKFIKEGKEDQIEMTDNEQSVPTSTWFLVRCIDYAIKKRMHGVLHAVPTFSSIDGVSRTSFAEAILADLDVEIVTVLPDKICTAVRTPDIEIHPVERHTYAPTKSAMLSSFSDAAFCGSWREDLSRFMAANRFELRKWLKEQLN